jgi:hypothetical protein
LVLEGYEQSAELAKLVRQEAESLLPDDDSFRAQGLRQLHDELVRNTEAAVSEGVQRAISTIPAVNGEATSIDLFSSMLDLEENVARSFG